MSWEKYAYTSAGAAMLSESISGGALTITRAVSGTGTVDTDLSEETAVSGDTYELKLLGIDTVEYEGEKARKVSIWTGGADKPYFMHQIGVFGRLNDDPEDTLLFLMQDDRGIEIPAIGTADHEFQIAVLLAVSTKANISLTVDPQVEAIMRMVREMVLKEISQHNDAPDAHAKIITEATSKALKELEESGQIMSEDRVKELIKESGGGAVSDGLDLALVEREGRLQQRLAVAGRALAQDVRTLRQLARERGDGALRRLNGTALIVRVVRPQQLAAFADERKLCRGRAGVHTEEAAARIASQVSLLHHRPRVARAERVVVLL